MGYGDWEAELTKILFDGTKKFSSKDFGSDHDEMQYNLETEGKWNCRPAVFSNLVVTTAHVLQSYQCVPCIETLHHFLHHYLYSRYSSPFSSLFTPFWRTCSQNSTASLNSFTPSLQLRLQLPIYLNQHPAFYFNSYKRLKILLINYDGCVFIWLEGVRCLSALFPSIIMASPTDRMDFRISLEVGTYLLFYLASYSK